MRSKGYAPDFLSVSSSLSVTVSINVNSEALKFFDVFRLPSILEECGGELFNLASMILNLHFFVRIVHAFTLSCKGCAMNFEN